MTKACKNCKYFNHIHVDTGKCTKFDSEESKNSICDTWAKTHIPIKGKGKLFFSEKEEWGDWTNSWTAASGVSWTNSWTSGSYPLDASLYIGNDLWKTQAVPNNPPITIEVAWSSPIKPLLSQSENNEIKLMEYKKFIFCLTDPSTLRYDLKEIV